MCSSGSVKPSGQKRCTAGREGQSHTHIAAGLAYAPPMGARMADALRPGATQPKDGTGVDCFPISARFVAPLPAHPLFATGRANALCNAHWTEKFHSGSARISVHIRLHGTGEDGFCMNAVADGNETCQASRRAWTLPPGSLWQGEADGVGMDGAPLRTWAEGAWKLPVAERWMSSAYANSADGEQAGRTVRNRGWNDS